MLTRPLPKLTRLAAAAALVLAGCLPNSNPTPKLAPDASPTPISAAAIGSHLDALQAIADANGGVRTAGTAGYEASGVDNVNLEQVATFGRAAAAVALAIATGELPVP